MTSADEPPPGRAVPAAGYGAGAASELVRSRRYWVLLVLSAAIGVVVSVASWAFLEITHRLQVGVYQSLPQSLGFAAGPWWWPLAVLAPTGVIVAFAVARLPGNGGHEPSDGLTTGAPTCSPRWRPCSSA